MRTLAEVCPRVSVLVVEDNPDAATSLSLLLELSGYRVRVAATGRAALALAAAAPPDVVLLDILLPDIDGWEVARGLRTLGGRKRPLIVAVTGLGREDDCRRSDEAGIDLHLTKPVAPRDLLAVLGRFARLMATGPAPRPDCVEAFPLTLAGGRV